MRSEILVSWWARWPRVASGLYSVTAQQTKRRKRGGGGEGGRFIYNRDYVEDGAVLDAAAHTALYLAAGLFPLTLRNGAEEELRWACLRLNTRKITN